MKIDNGEVIYEDDIVYNETSVTYVQNGDSNDSRDLVQTLKIKHEDAGGGKYITFSTERWAADGIDEIIEIFRDFEAKSKASAKQR